ncbi:MAG: response regulator [Chloroflexota bacterium]
MDSTNQVVSEPPVVLIVTDPNQHAAFEKDKFIAHMQMEHLAYNMADVRCPADLHTVLLEKKPDIILWDDVCSYGGMLTNGMREIPVILLLQESRRVHLAQALQDGINHYIIKDSNGYYIHEIPFIIDHLLVAHRTAQALRASEMSYHKVAERLKILHEIRNQILDAQSLREIARTVLNFLIRLIPHRQACVVEYDTDRDQGIVLTSHPDRNGQPAKIEDNVYSLTDFEYFAELGSHDIFYVDGDDAQFIQLLLSSGLYDSSTDSFLVVPLVAEEIMVGALILGREAENPFASEDLEVFKEVADKMAVSIQQTILRRQQERYASDLESRVAQRTQELQKANKELEQAARTKDEFLANMSHELRTPLNAILGLSEALMGQKRGPLNERQLKLLGVISDSGKSLLTLVNDIIDLAKIGADRLEFQSTLVSVGGVCRACVNTIQELADEKQIQLHLNVTSTPQYIEADQQRLKQMLVNLLDNAVKFTDVGGEVGLDVQSDTLEELIYFRVWDTGVGISTENQEQLFQPFTLLDSSLSRSFSGSGLGLALVAQLTKLHKGSITIDSKPGVGSTFTITMPWDYTTVEDEPEEIGTGTGGGYAIVDSDEDDDLIEDDDYIDDDDGENLPLLLLADDNEINRLTIQEFLEDEGFEVETASNGQEVLDFMAIRKPDLILMDIQMPVMNGLEATTKIRANPDYDDILVLALTAAATAKDRQACLDAGADNYVSKPIDPSTLVIKISTLLGEF